MRPTEAVIQFLQVFYFVSTKRKCFNSDITVIQRGISDNNQDQPSINEGYMYYLSGRAKLGNAEKEGQVLAEELIMGIYLDFNGDADKILDQMAPKGEVYNDILRILRRDGGLTVTLY